MPKESEFLKVAEQAAKLERKGDLDEAALRWNDAYQVAGSEANEHWCRIRTELCQAESARRYRRARGIKG